jgi:hypothetical protein
MGKKDKMIQEFQRKNESLLRDGEEMRRKEKIEELARALKEIKV